MKFVYVMSQTDRDKMLTLGYQLIKEDKQHNVYVFCNKDTMTFSSEDEISNAGISFVLSDILTF